MGSKDKKPYEKILLSANFKNEFTEKVGELHKCIGTDSFKNKMDELAKFILEKCKLQNKDTGKKFLIDEIEFYLCNSKHEDPYCHSFKSYKNNSDHPQDSLLYWYFHGSGMDITIGDRDIGIYGGILIRSVCGINDNKKIKGPLNSRAKVLGLDTGKGENTINKCEERMKDITIFLDENNSETFSCLSGNTFIANIPRHGLNPMNEINAHSELEIENKFRKLNSDSFYCKNYRYKIFTL